MPDRRDRRSDAPMPPGHQLLLLSRMASETLGGYDVTVAVPDIVLAHPDHLDRGAVHGLSSFDRCNLPVRNGQQESCDSVGQHFPLPHLTRRRCSHNSDVFFGTGLWLLTPSWEEMRATTLDAIAATADRPAPADPIAATADQPAPADPIAATADRPMPADPITATADRPAPADPIAATADRPMPADPIAATADRPMPADPIT